MKRVYLGILLCLAVSSCFAQSADFVVTNVRVFDGETVLSSTNVVVREGRIAAIGETADADGVPRIDGEGATLLPGLLDAHTHTDYVEQLQEALRFGVTTVLDMGTFPPGERALREAAASRLDVADFRSPGILATAPGGHGTEYGVLIPTVAGTGEAAGFVQDRVTGGADYLKIVINGVLHAQTGMPMLDAETVHALADAARDHDLMVLAHVESVDDVRLAIDAGIDGLVHTWRDSGAQPELSRLLAANSIFVMPTFALDSILGDGPRVLLSDPRIAPFLSDLSRQTLSQEWEEDLPAGISIDRQFASMQSLAEAGVVLLAGSDAFAKQRMAHGATLHRLLELFVKAGLAPAAALRTATANVADAFGLDDRGRIRPGLIADLLLVDGDPTADITSTRNIVKIWRAGREFDRGL